MTSAQCRVLNAAQVAQGAVNSGSIPETLKVATPRHLIGDLHEWSNETAAVPTHVPANAQLGERAQRKQRVEKTPLSSALACGSAAVTVAEVVGRFCRR